MVVREEKLRHFSERGQETVLSLWCIYDILCYEGRKVNLLMFLAFAKNVVLELNMNMISLIEIGMLCQNTEVFSLNSRMCTKNIIAF